MLDEKKKQIIYKIYTDRAGFGSIADTLKEVRKLIRQSHIMMLNNGKKITV